MRKSSKTPKLKPAFVANISGDEKGLGLMLLDAHGRIAQVNDAYLEMTGFKGLELFGKAFFSLAAPGDSGARKLWDALKTQGYSWGEVCESKKDGRHLWTENVALPASPMDGTPTYLLLRRDVTALKYESQLMGALAPKAEHNQEIVDRILKGGGEGVFSVRADGNVLFVNEAGASMFDTKASELVGQPLPFAWTKPDEEDDEMRTSEVEATTRTGKKVICEVSITAFAGPNAKQSGYIVFVEDVTELRELQVKVFESAKIASIAELAIGVAHEINNPLAVVAGNVDRLEQALVSRDVADENIREMVESQRRSIERIKGIVEGVRAFAKVDFGRTENIYVEPMIREAVALFSSYAPYIIFSTDEHIGAEWIRGDAQKLRQVVQVLLSNAKDAVAGMPNPAVKVHLSKIPEGMQLVVKDNGVGISEPHRLRVFDPFFTTKDPGKGTGLGLSIARSALERLNGTISFESSEGNGTTFTITVPLLGAVQKQMFGKTDEVQEPITRKKKGGRVLIVDDESELRDLLRWKLESWGLIVEEASDGIQGLELLSKNTYDVFITDLFMPKMTGGEMVRKVRERGIQTPFIVFSAGSKSDFFGSKGDEDMTGFLDLCSKPCSEVDFLKALGKVFGPLGPAVKTA